MSVPTQSSELQSRWPVQSHNLHPPRLITPRDVANAPAHLINHRACSALRSETCARLSDNRMARRISLPKKRTNRSPAVAQQPGYASPSPAPDQAQERGYVFQSLVGTRRDARAGLAGPCVKFEKESGVVRSVRWCRGVELCYFSGAVQS